MNTSPNDTEATILPVYTDFLFTTLICAHRMRVNFCPQHSLLCHSGLVLVRVQANDVGGVHNALGQNHVVEAYGM